MIEFKNLEEKLKDLSSKFKDDLIKALDSKGHNKTGQLEKSIEFTFNIQDNEYLIQLSCLEYIQYLEHGDFLKDFLDKKQEELTKILPNIITIDIMNQFDTI